MLWAITFLHRLANQLKPTVFIHCNVWVARATWPLSKRRLFGPTPLVNKHMNLPVMGVETSVSLCCLRATIQRARSALI